MRELLRPARFVEEDSLFVPIVSRAGINCKSPKRPLCRYTAGYKISEKTCPPLNPFVVSLHHIHRINTQIIKYFYIEDLP